MRCFAGHGTSNRRVHGGPARLGPQLWPELACKGRKIVDFHGTLTIHVHGQQRARAFHDLDAVRALLEGPMHVDGAAVAGAAAKRSGRGIHAAIIRRMTVNHCLYRNFFFRICMRRHL
jgi:hypothetical protein